MCAPSYWTSPKPVPLMLLAGINHVNMLPGFRREHYPYRSVATYDADIPECANLQARARPPAAGSVCHRDWLDIERPSTIGLRD